MPSTDVTERRRRVARRRASGACSSTCRTRRFRCCSVVDLGIVRYVRARRGAASHVGAHADLLRLSRDRSDPRRRSSAHCTQAGYRDVQRRRGAVAALDQRLADRQRARASCASSASRRPPNPSRSRVACSARSTVACPRCAVDADRARQRIRLDALQGALSLHDCPRAVRILQVHLRRALKHAQVSSADKCARSGPKRRTRSASCSRCRRSCATTIASAPAARRPASRLDWQEVRRTYSITAARRRVAI